MTRTQKRRDQRRRHKARIKYWNKTRLYLAEEAFAEWRQLWLARLASIRNINPNLPPPDGRRLIEALEETVLNRYGSGGR